MTGEQANANVLIDQCIQNDRRAQRQLYELYKKAMYSVAYRILNDPDLAHDALQDGFIEVFRDLKNFQNRSTIGAWIKMIIVRKALLKLKTETRYESIDISQHAAPIVWPEQMTGEYLDKAIRELPAGYRAVFTLVEVEGYAHKEVAEMLRISESTSRSQLHHGKKLLQKKLTELMK